MKAEKTCDKMGWGRDSFSDLILAYHPQHPGGLLLRLGRRGDPCEAFLDETTDFGQSLTFISAWSSSRLSRLIQKGDKFKIKVSVSCLTWLGLAVSCLIIRSACPESELCLADAELNLPRYVRWGLGGATQEQFATSVRCNKEMKMYRHILGNLYQCPEH